MSKRIPGTVLPLLLLLAVSPTACPAPWENRLDDLEDRVYADLGVYAGTLSRYCTLFGVDAKTVCAILYVEKIQYELDILRKSKKTLEETFARYPLVMNGIFVRMELSVGYVHLKPAFARTVFERLQGYPAYRHILGAHEIDPLYYCVQRDAAFRIMTAGLFLLQDEWESSPEGISIRDRPEILATLYNLGFERSRPHRHPTAGGTTLPMIMDGRLYRDVPFGEKVRMLHDGSRKLARFMERRFPQEIRRERKK